VGKECGAHGGEEKRIPTFGQGQRGRHTCNGSILRNRLRDMNRTNMAQDMDTCHEHGNRPSGAIKCGNIPTI
jgi:hypothetical protein